MVGAIIKITIQQTRLWSCTPVSIKHRPIKLGVHASSYATYLPYLGITSVSKLLA